MAQQACAHRVTVGVDHNPGMKLQTVLRPLGAARALAPTTGMPSRAPVWTAALIWLLAGLLLAWWLLGVSAQRGWQTVPVLPASAVQPDPAAVARALGHSDRPAAGVVTPPAAVNRLRLVGVVAQPGAQGAALIAVDGQPPRPFLAGSPVADAWTLTAVERTHVTLRPSDGHGADVELRVPQQPR